MRIGTILITILALFLVALPVNVVAETSGGYITGVQDGIDAFARLVVDEEEAVIGCSGSVGDENDSCSCSASGAGSRCTCNAQATICTCCDNTGCIRCAMQNGGCACQVVQAQ